MYAKRNDWFEKAQTNLANPGCFIWGRMREEFNHCTISAFVVIVISALAVVAVAYFGC